MTTIGRMSREWAAASRILCFFSILRQIATGPSLSCILNIRAHRVHMGQLGDALVQQWLDAEIDCMYCGLLLGGEPDCLLDDVWTALCFPIKDPIAWVTTCVSTFVTHYRYYVNNTLPSIETIILLSMKADVFM